MIVDFVTWWFVLSVSVSLLAGASIKWADAEDAL